MLKLALLIVVGCAACQAADRASWYGERHRRLPMANGKPFNPDNLTAASWFYNLGDKVAVTSGGRSMVVDISDRGPAHRYVKAGRTIDLGKAAFEKLADPKLGLIEVGTRLQLHGR